MKKIKYLTPILGLSAMVGVAAPIATSCAQASESTTLPYNLLDIQGVTLKGFVKGTDFTKYDTIIIPEGVKYIDSFAFGEYDPEAEEDLNFSTIKTLKLPASVRKVNPYAFVGLSSLKNIDLTSWDNDTIKYCDFPKENDSYPNNAFGVLRANEDRYCKVNLPEGLSLQEEEQVKEKLTGVATDIYSGAGIPDWWYIDQTTGHISATEGVSKDFNAIATNETSELRDGYIGGYFMQDGYINLTLAETFDTTKYYLEVYAEPTAQTAEDDVLMVAGSDESKPHQPIIEDYTKAKIQILTRNYKWDKSITDYLLDAEGHSINFDVNVVCRKVKDDSVVWNEKVEGYKSTNKYTHVDPDGVEIDPDSKSLIQWLGADPRNTTVVQTTQKPTVTVSPSTAVAQNLPFNSISWLSSDESVAKWIEKVGGNEWLACYKPGIIELTAQSSDNYVSDSMSVTVPGIECDKVTSGDIQTGSGTYYHENVIGSTYGKQSDALFGYTIPKEHELLFKITVGSDSAYDTIKTSNGKYRIFQVNQAVTQAGIYGENQVQPSSANIWYYKKSEGYEKQHALTLGTDFSINYGCIGLYDTTTTKDLVFENDDVIYINFVFDEQAAGLEHCGFLADKRDA